MGMSAWQSWIQVGIAILGMTYAAIYTVSEVKVSTAILAGEVRVLGNLLSTLTEEQKLLRSRQDNLRERLGVSESRIKQLSK